MSQRIAEHKIVITGIFQLKIRDPGDFQRLCDRMYKSRLPKTLAESE